MLHSRYLCYWTFLDSYFKVRMSLGISNFIQYAFMILLYMDSKERLRQTLSLFPPRKAHKLLLLNISTNSL